VASRVGLDAELAVLGELARGAHDITGFEAGDLARASVLAERYHTRDLLILDHRHFRCRASPLEWPFQAAAVIVMPRHEGLGRKKAAPPQYWPPRVTSYCPNARDR
jgi:hypothetical protein